MFLFFWVLNISASSFELKSSSNSESIPRQCKTINASLDLLLSIHGRASCIPEIRENEKEGERKSSNGIQPDRTYHRRSSIDRHWIASSPIYVQHAFRGQIDGSISHPHAELSRAASPRRACGRQSFKNAVVISCRLASGQSAADPAGDSVGRWRSSLNASVSLERERVRIYRMSPRDHQRLASNVPKDTTRAGQHGKWFRAW